MISFKFLIIGFLFGVALISSAYYANIDYVLISKNFNQAVENNLVRNGNVTDEDSSYKVVNLQNNKIKNKTFTLINITNFQFIINNDICNVSKIPIVTIIHSAIENKESRKMIRETWGNPSIPGAATRLVFLLGYTSNEKQMDMIKQESTKHQDIVQGGFLDTYHNLSYKAILGNLWVSEFCNQAEFVVKTDDDMFVDLYEVYSFTRDYLTNTQYIHNKFLLCPAWRGLPIIRDNTKWGVSYEDIPRDTKFKEGKETYPTSCSGWLWITNPGTSKAIAEAASEVKFFWIDDVWVTGYIAKHLKILHQDCIKYWTISSEKLLLYKAIQSPDFYCPDYMSGPMLRDKGLNLALHTRARWCYQHNCQNNIYNKHVPHKISELNFSQMIKKYFPFNPKH